MIIKEIKLQLDGNKLATSLVLKNAKGTELTRKVDLSELAKINVGDDVSVNNKKIKVLKKNNKMQLIFALTCPDCGQPLSKKAENVFVCTNTYGCKNQREQLLKNWCKRFKLLSVIPYITDILNYYSLDNGRIIDRPKKLATEQVIPLIYLFTQNDWYTITRDSKVAQTIFKDIQKTKKGIKTADLLAIFPNEFSEKERKDLSKKYPETSRFINLFERDRASLTHVISAVKVSEIFHFNATNKDTYDLLQQLGIKIY